MFAEFYKFPKNYWSVHLKLVNSVVCELYHNKTIQKCYADEIPWQWQLNNYYNLFCKQEI